jgi:hypothetical protein
MEKDYAILKKKMLKYIWKINKVLLNEALK